jgi:hypothetical protein
MEESKPDGVFWDHRGNERNDGMEAVKLEKALRSLPGGVVQVVDRAFSSKCKSLSSNPSIIFI